MEEILRRLKNLKEHNINSLTIEEIETLIEKTRPKIYVVDWDKVDDIEDMKVILKGLGIEFNLPLEEYPEDVQKLLIEKKETDR